MIQTIALYFQRFNSWYLARRKVRFLSFINLGLASNNFMKDSDRRAVEMQKLEALLANAESPEHDLELFWNCRAPRTCKWILEEPKFLEWEKDIPESKALWLYARPGRGKSVLSSFIIHRLQEQGVRVQYFFFRFDDETKRTIGSLLKALALQIASQIPDYRKALVNLADSGYKFKDSDWRPVWQKLFTSLEFKIESFTPVYWVIDAIDESDSPNHILELLSTLSRLTIPVRVILTSRWSPTLSSSFERLDAKVPSTVLSGDEDLKDIRIYVEEGLNYLSWDSTLKREVIDRITSQANDNFLWV